MTDYLIQAQGLHKSFGENHAVNDVSLQIAAGEIYGLVGSDGAGKTTTLRLLVGALQADAGEIEVGGYDVRNRSSRRVHRSAIFRSVFALRRPDRAGKHPFLCRGARAFIKRMAAALHGNPRICWPGRIQRPPRRSAFGRDEAKTGSGLRAGYPPARAAARRTHHRRRPVTRQDFWQLVIRLVASPPISEGNGGAQGGKGGVSVLLTTPYMDEAARCHRVGFMREGKIIAEGTPSELRATLDWSNSRTAWTPHCPAAQVAHQDEDVEDVQAFGDRLHVRVGENKAEVVLSRLKSRIRSEGGEVTDLRPVPPGLEDVFIALSESDSDRKGGLQEQSHD